MKICGIYKIENTINKKAYIGQSKNIPLRFSNHKYELNKNIHPNHHLQRAWNKYGKENFIFEILCECSIEKLNEKEIYFIGLYSSFEHGYNKTEGGTDSETAAEFGRKLAEVIHERRRTRKNKCIECGEETENGYNKYCSNHKNKCKKCGKRFCDLLHPVTCQNCIIKYNIGYCSECGKEIKKGSNKQKYCKKCARIIKNKKQKILMRKLRSVTK